MKKFLYVLVCLLLIASIGGFAYLLKGAGKDKPKDTFVSTEQSEERVDSSEEDEPIQETVVKGLTVPENEEELIAKGLTMRKGATLDFTEGERAIRITCDITQELYDEVKTDENNEWCFEDISEQIRKEPERHLLLITYALMEPRNSLFDWRFEFCRSEKLEALYDFLEELGYQVSDEERALLDGTHELFFQPEEEAEAAA